MWQGMEMFVIVKHASLLGQRLQKIIAFDTDFKSVSPQTDLINMQLKRRTLSDTGSGSSSALNWEKINENKIKFLCIPDLLTKIRQGMEMFGIVNHTSLLGHRLQKSIAFDTISNPFHLRLIWLTCSSKEELCLTRGAAVALL